MKTLVLLLSLKSFICFGQDTYIDGHGKSLTKIETLKLLRKQPDLKFLHCRPVEFNDKLNVVYVKQFKKVSGL